jgi:hypothetical protein
MAFPPALAQFPHFLSPATVCYSPARWQRQQRQVAGGDHDLIKSAGRQAPGVKALHLADLAEARHRDAGQILDIDKVQPTLGKPPPPAG